MDKNSPEKDIQAIVERYMNNTCTRAEFEELLEFARMDKNLLFGALKTQWDKTVAPKEDEKAHFDQVFDTIMHEANSLEDARGASQKNPSNLARNSNIKRLTIRIAIAASIAVCIFAGAWWLQQSGKKARAKDQAATAILPGSDKAILTLADGTQIALDTAHNGDITSQGGAKVIKLDGRLHYNALAANGNEDQLYNTITTPRGGQYELILADGSKVWLNASSSLKFPATFAGNERNVELTGEGYFEITHNPAQPFHVKAGRSTVTVLGTHFDINSYADEAAEKTTLIEGRVAVNTGNAHADLVPGQQAVTNTGQDHITVAKNVAIDEVLAWKNGLFLYNSTDLETVMNQVARWYDVTIVYEKKTNETISGSLPRSGDFRQLLKILEATGKVSFKINGRVITVRPH